VPTVQQGVAPRQELRQDREQGRNLTRHPGISANAPAAVTGNAQSGPSGSGQAFAPPFRGNSREFRGAPPGFRASNQPSPARALSNQTFANPARFGARSALANSTFRGRFAGVSNIHHRQRFHRARVIGWFGPLFWPYAYYDMFDYAFWPYAYDTFWPYAYDDIYGGMFGPYAYGYDVPSGPPPGSSYQPGPSGSDNEPGNALDREAQVCSERATVLTNWPIERIAQTVQPNAAQTAALDRLMMATGRAVDILQSACPTRLPSTPTGRLATLQSRLEAMLRAVETVAPALNAFYQLLDDEQRARFDSMGQERDPSLANQDRTDLTQVCSERGTGVALPIDRIEQEVRPDERQRAALDNLANASARAAEMLRSNCPAEAALTPTGRISGMRQRLTVMLDAVIMVRPALEAFYGSLSYEQRARFNVIGGQEG
jgi:hypothetical protein